MKIIASLLLGLAACSKIIGIGDLPGSPDASVHDDASVDGSVCTAEQPDFCATGAFCTDLSTDPHNCGQCGMTCGAGQYCAAGGCVDSVQQCGGQTCSLAAKPSGTTVSCIQGTCSYDAAAHGASWSALVASDILALWPDGTVTAGGYTFDAGGAGRQPYDTALVNGYEHLSLVSIYVPAAGSPLLFTHRQATNSWTEDAQHVLGWNTHGCCDYNDMQPIAIDVTVGVGFYVGLSAASQFSLTSMVPQSTLDNPVGGANGHNFAIVSKRRTFVTGEGTLAFADWNASHRVFSRVLVTGSAYVGPGAAIGTDWTGVDSDGKLYRIDRAGNDVWPALTLTAVPAALQPLTVTSATAIFALTGDPGIVAVSAASGTILWSKTLAGQPTDLLVADGERLFVLVPSQHEVLVLDRSDGSMLDTISYEPGPGSTTGAMLLQNRILYVNEGGLLRAIPVAAHTYAKDALWPVRAHDNQRTSCTDMSLAY